jgi:hypothetical protein
LNLALAKVAEADNLFAIGEIFMPKDQFKISLRENGEHSFKKSLESYNQYDKTKDQMLLKDTIMFLHHGIELLMKEMLVRHSLYLIFEDLKELPKKQKEANKKGVSIFNIDSPPKSVAYEVAISRVDAFLNYPELDDNLRQNLERLNRFRNQLEHYAIEVDREEVVRLLEAIHKPILVLFEKYMGPMTQLQTPQIKQTWDNISNVAKEAQRVSHEVYELMKMFNGQKVPGNLLGVDGEVTLPKFDRVFEEYAMEVGEDNESRSRYLFDILAETANFSTGEGGARWVVETKLRAPRSDTVYQVSAFGQFSNAKPWLVAFDKIPISTRDKAKGLKVMITGQSELEELRKLLSQTSE